jgi:hypothetical protein
MKYVKLFENWLNEAEGGAVKPAPAFNPKKPSKTLVVDISQKDMAACLTTTESLQNCLYSFLNRGYFKKDPLDSDEDQIICVPCRIGYSGRDEKKVGSKKKYYFTQSIKNDYEDLGFPDNRAKLIWEDPDADPDASGDSGVDGNVKQFKEMKENKAPVFYITKSGFIPKVDKDEVFQPSPGAFFLIPADTKYNWNDTFKGTEKDFALNSQFTIIDGRDLNNQTVTLGDLVLNIQDALNNNKRIKPSSPKPQDIAQALGYTIPDNYTPKMGGIEVKAK